MSIKTYIADIVVLVLADARTEPVLERIATNVVAKTVVPIIPAAVGAAVDAAAKHLLDLDQDGKPDVTQVVDAAKSVVDQFLPPWLQGMLSGKVPG